MKIVLIGKFNNKDLLNGPEKVARRLFENISKTDNCVSFIEYFFKTSGKTSLYKRLFGYQKTGQEGNILRMGILRLFLFLVKTQPDVIHFVTEERFQMSIFLYRFLLTGKIFVTVHGLLKYESDYLAVRPSVFSRLKDLALEYLFFNLSDRLIFVSQKLLEFSSGYYKYDRGKAFVIPNGVDSDFIRNNKEFNFNSAVKMVTYSGEIKNNISVECLADLRNLNTSRRIEIYILGKSAGNEEHNGSINIRNCKLLPREELIKFLEDKHFYINVNEYESFSIFALECMAAGLIPIVSKDVGMSEYIKNGLNGFKIQNLRSGELKSVLESIINNKYDINFISRNAADIKETLNWPLIAEKYINLYKMDN